MSGFFIMHRGWRDNPIFRGEFSRADAWVWLIENAAWRPTRVRIKGTTVELERGQLSFSQRFLAESWGWSKSRVDRFMSELRDEGMIETCSKIGAVGGHKAGQGQIIITICNYSKYQDVSDSERGNSGATSGATAGQQRGKEEQGNKGTIEEEPIGPSSKEGQSDDFKTIVDAWNAMAGHTSLGTVAKLSDKRRASLKVRIADYGTPEILSAIETIPRSRFLRGENNRGWKADFDFLIRPDSVLHIMEGKYDDRSQTNRGSAPGGYDRRDGLERACDEIIGGDGPDRPRQPSGEAGRFDVIEGGRHRGG